MLYIKRFFHDTKSSYFLFGPRGTGKTTWLEKHFTNGLFINLLDAHTLRVLSSNPERLEQIVSESTSKTIILDEIQKIPELLSTVHLLIEKKMGYQFILTGSSSRKLKRAGVDLLAGRALLKHIHPFMAAELQDHFNLKKALTYGLVPINYMSDNPADNLHAYIGLYLKEEVQTEGLIRNLSHFSRFLEIMSLSQGSQLNLSNIARECFVSRNLVENYLSILYDLLIAFELPVFTKRAKRITTTHSKFYYFDAGVFQSIRPKGILDSPQEIGGIALETLVLQHLRAWNDYHNHSGNLFYWRTKHGVEVDFVFYGPNEFVAIEVKSKTNIFDKDLSGLEIFGKDYPEATLIMLYQGIHRLKIGNVSCIPIEEFLRRLIPTKPLHEI